LRETLAQGTIRLRRYRPGDGPRLYQAVLESIPELTRRGFYRVDYTPQRANADVRSNIRQWDKGQAFAYVIEEGPEGVPEEAPEGTCVGQCRVEEIEYEHRNAALGWWVRTSCTGRGIATAAARLAAQAAFEDLNLIHLHIYMASDNVASRRVAEKIGGVLEGILRSQRIGPSGPIDCAVYGLLPGELRLE
jgi:ribosomal-protein-serine acetyltransferase